VYCAPAKKGTSHKIIKPAAALRIIRELKVQKRK
jgi:hypothetical protein